MTDQTGNVYTIDTLAHSAATSSHVLQLHQVVLRSAAEPEVSGELAVLHSVIVSIVRDSAAGALRAAADWMDQHQDMDINGIAVANRYPTGSSEPTTEVRLFVDFP